MNKKINILWLVLAVVIIIIITSSISSIKKDREKEQLQQPVTAENKKDTLDEKKQFIEENKEEMKTLLQEDYSDKIAEEEAKKVYIEGCTESGDASVSYCVCTWNYLIAKNGLNDVLDISVEVAKGNVTDEISEKILEAVYNCIE